MENHHVYILGKSMISMVIFNSCVGLEGNHFGRGQAPIQNQDHPSSELSTCLPWWLYALHLWGSGYDSVSNCPYKINRKNACFRGSTPWYYKGNCQGDIVIIIIIIIVIIVVIVISNIIIHYPPTPPHSLGSLAGLICISIVIHWDLL